jgi:hypothetical protein
MQAAAGMDDDAGRKGERGEPTSCFVFWKGLEVDIAPERPYFHAVRQRAVT